VQVAARLRCPTARLTSSALILALGVGSPATSLSLSGPDILQPPKESQTAAQRKIDSRLLREIERVRRSGEKVQGSATAGVGIDAKGRALVEIRCDVTDAMRATLRRLGATTISSLPDYRSILAWVPLLRLEELAAGEAVYGIQPAPESTTNQRRKGRE
jgi:hypothetical protein